MKATLLSRFLYYAILVGLMVINSACGSLWGVGDPLMAGNPSQSSTQTTDTPTLATGTPSSGASSAIPPSPVPTASVTPSRTPVPPTPTLDPFRSPDPPILYYSLSGDSLQAVAAHFGVQVSEITSTGVLAGTGLLEPGTPLLIPDRLDATTPDDMIMPDSEVVLSSSVIGFDISSYVQEADGYLADYYQYVAYVGRLDGVGVVDKAARDSSVNPRLLLALIEYESGWVTGVPEELTDLVYPLGNIDSLRRDLYHQLEWVIEELSVAYYGWRVGKFNELTFIDGTKMRLSPMLNAGTVAIMHYFAMRNTVSQWEQALDPADGFPALYERMFGNPVARAQTVEPLMTAEVVQPELSLPFAAGQTWSYSGGPHVPWLERGAQAALDFGPGSKEGGCVESYRWVLAPAAGLVIKAMNGVVLLDLNGDGYEETGWVLLFLHIAEKDRVVEGTWLNADERIGHPSCEGGVSTGTHVHMARKYNGEWMQADGPVPFVMSGWTAHSGAVPYKGTLTKGDLVCIASVDGLETSSINRSPDD